MKRSASFFLLALGLTTPAWAATNVGISVQIGNAPPPPVVEARAEPHLVYVSDARVWVVEDEQWTDDCFRSGGVWFTWHDGWWYRSRSWRGPYRAIEARYVPAGIRRVPERRWKHYPHEGRHGDTRERSRRPEVRHHDRDRDSEAAVVEGREHREHHERHDHHEHEHHDDD